MAPAARGTMKATFLSLLVEASKSTSSPSAPSTKFGSMLVGAPVGEESPSSRPTVPSATGDSVVTVGPFVGEAVATTGADDGVVVGDKLGTLDTVGEDEGAAETVGATEGAFDVVGAVEVVGDVDVVGDGEGCDDSVGLDEGRSDGDRVGAKVGPSVGLPVGPSVGSEDGEALDITVGPLV